jgi:hypothetical protein
MSYWGIFFGPLFALILFGVIGLGLRLAIARYMPDSWLKRQLLAERIKTQYSAANERLARESIERDRHRKPLNAMQRVLAVGFSVGIVLLAVVMTFSASEHRYQCSGTLVKDGVTARIGAYLTLDEYRWWVRLWSESEGKVKLEFPRISAVYFYDNVRKVGDFRQIYSVTGGELAGNFSHSRNAISIQSTSGLFDGACTVIT